MNMPYDYESYFQKESKQKYWKDKQVLDQKYLAPLVNSNLKTLNAGAGIFVEKSLLQLNDVTCIDISKTAVEQLRKAGVKVKQADLREKWPFKNEEFKQILLLDIFEHLGPIGVFLQECSRVCSMNGRLVLGIPLLNYWKSRLQLLIGSTKGVQYDEHVRMFFDKDVRALFYAVGFDLIKAVYLGRTKGYGYYCFEKKRPLDKALLGEYGAQLSED